MLDPLSHPFTETTLAAIMYLSTLSCSYDMGLILTMWCTNSVLVWSRLSMTEKSRYGVPQNVLKLSTTLAMSLHTTPEMQLLPVLTTLPPPTPPTRGAVNYAHAVRSCCGGHGVLVRTVSNYKRGYNDIKASAGSNNDDAAWSMSRFVVDVGSVRTTLPPVAGKKV